MLLSGQFQFWAGVFTGEYKHLCSTNSNPFIGSCYATSVCILWQNDLDTTTFRLNFDKKIVTGNDTLFPQTDILKHPVFRKYVPINPVYSDCKGLYYSIGTEDTTTTHNMVFDTTVYKATFTCTTTDGKPLLAERYMRFEQ